LVEEAKLDLFDLAVYHPTIKEVRQVVKEEGSFTLQTLKTFKIGWDANLQEDTVDCVLDSKMRGEFIAKYHRACFWTSFNSWIWWKHIGWILLKICKVGWETPGVREIRVY